MGKRYLLLFLCVVWLLISSSCNVFKNRKHKINNLDLVAGYQLNYNLAYGEERYQFIVDVYEVAPYRTFRYTMTNKGRTSAVLSLTPEALKSARKEKNEFTGYSDTLENDKITIWFSQVMFDDIVKKDTAYFNPNVGTWGKSENVQFYNAGLALFEYELNGRPQLIEVIKVQELDGNRNFLVLNNRENPLIIRMDINWVIWLKEINFQEK